MLATRLWQNTAKVHFDATNREDGRRLIYGGHVISMARALSFNGLANAQVVAAINAGAHANPVLRRRHRRRLVGGPRQGRDPGAGRRRAAPAHGRDQGRRPRLRPLRTRSESTARTSFSTSTTGFWCRCDREI